MIRKKDQKLRQKYSLDKKELGKVLFIASAAFLVISVHAAMEFQSSMEDIEQTNNKLEETSAIINSEGFQDSIEALETVRGTQIAPQFIQASEAFNSAEEAINETQETEERLKSSYNSYRWVVLASILGMVAGASIIYV